MRNTKTTNKDVPEEIKKLIPEAERTLFINTIIKEAEAGEFNCWTSEKYATPKIALHKKLLECKDIRLSEIITGIETGVYDEIHPKLKK